MPLNKDGLEAGQPVDFTTLMRVKRQQESKDVKPAATPKARRSTVRDLSATSDKKAAQETQDS